MAIIKKISVEGQKSDNTLRGEIRIEWSKGRIVLFDGTYNRMIIGFLPDGTIGIAISKPGEDVFSAFS